MAKKSKFFRVATAGATTDGRNIDAVQLQQMARNYDRNKYGARIFVEHIRGLNPEWGFRAMGDVLALRTGEIQIDGQNRVTLEAQIEPTDELVTLTRKGQKIYSSIEISPAFAGTKEAYLFGLGVTDSPSSLGTEILQFAAQHPASSPFSARKQQPGNLFSEAIEIDLEFEDIEDEAPSLLERITQLFKTRRADDSARVADVHSAVEQVARVAGDAQVAADQATADLATLRQEFGAARTATDQQLQAFATRLDTTPAPAAQRSPATGAAAAVMTDC